MKTIHFFTTTLYGQKETVDKLPVAIIDQNYRVTLDDSKPLSEDYKADISHLSFANETVVKSTLKKFLTANLISNEVHSLITS